MEIRLTLALFLGCLVTTAALVPLVMGFARRVGAVDRGGYRKVYKGEVPLLGGLAIAIPILLLAFLISAAGRLIVGNWQWIWLNHREWFSPLFSLAAMRHQCLVVALGGVAIIALGLFDDIKGMRARWKLLGQLVVGVSVCVSGFIITTVSVPFFGTLELGIGLGGFVTVLWVAGLINAFNLIDGIDGLAAGISLIGAAALVALSVVQGNVYVTCAGAALAGGLVAFLPFNFPPAKTFLGDTGSMFLGYSLAMISLTQKSETATILFAPLLALSLPVFETTVSILRRYVRGVPVFVGDNLHTHHRLLRKGFSEPRVVLTLYGGGLLLAASAVMSALIPEQSHWSWFSYALYAGTLVYIAWLAGYLRPASFRKVLARRNRNKIMQALARYGALCMDSGVRSAKLNLLLDLCRHELDLRYLEVTTRLGDWSVTSSGLWRGRGCENARSGTAREVGRRTRHTHTL